MGNVLSPDTKVLATSLMKLGVDAKMTSDIGEAFSNNNTKLFESLVGKLFADNNINVETKLKIKDLLKVSVSGVLSDNKLQMFTGDTMTSVAAVGAMFLVILALIFREGVPLSVPLFLLFGLGIACFGYMHVTAVIAKMKAVEEKIDASCPTSTSIAEVKDTETNSEGQYICGLLKKAGCDQLVSAQVFNNAKAMHAIRVLNVVTEYSSNMIIALQSTLKSGKDSDTFGLHSTKREARHEMTKMQESINKMNAAVKQTIDLHSRAAFCGSGMLDAIADLIQSIEFEKRSTPFQRPECFLRAHQLTIKKDMEIRLKQQMHEFTTLAKKALNNLATGGIEEFKHQEVFDQCSSLVQVYSWTRDIEDEQLKAVKEAARIRDEFDTQLCEYSTQRGKTEVEIDMISEKRTQKQFTFDLQMHEINSKITQQKKLLQGLGQGTIKMVGSPPCSDKQAVLRWDLWQQGRWNDLMEMGSYRSGSFSITIDANLTREQREGTDIMTNYIAQADALKTTHNEAMELLLKENDAKQKSLEKHKKAQKLAQTNCENSKAQAEPYWAVFKAKHPVQFSEITMVYNIKDCFLKAAQWMFRADVRCGALKSMVDKVEQQARSDSFNIDVTLATAKMIHQLLSDKNTSSIAFLTGLGEFSTKQELMPFIKAGNASDMKNELKAFEPAIEVD